MPYFITNGDNCLMKYSITPQPKQLLVARSNLKGGSTLADGVSERNK